MRTKHIMTEKCFLSALLFIGQKDREIVNQKVLFKVSQVRAKIKTNLYTVNTAVCVIKFSLLQNLIN